MGCGTSVNGQERAHKAVQMPPTSHTQQHPQYETLPAMVAAPMHAEHPPSRSRTQQQQQQQQQHQRPQQLEWPLPPDIHGPQFELKRNFNTARYSLKSTYDMALSPRPDSPAVTVKSKAQLHQKETSSSQWDKANSSIHDSAHVRSTLQTQSHSCIDLSTAEEITTLMADMNSAHTKLDHIVRRRLVKVSEETEKVLETIAKDAVLEQQDLLVFAKERQTKQDKLYREWLQKYIAVLDEWKSEKLAELQEELQIHQKMIIEASQGKITAVNKEANVIKAQILKDEQQKASDTITGLISKIEELSDHNTLQFLGSETMTNINVMVHANVGRKAAGQDCKFKFEDNNFTRSGNPDDQQTGSVNKPKK